MTKEELVNYIQKNGNKEKAIETVRRMKAEGVPMTIEELDRRINMKASARQKGETERGIDGNYSICRFNTKRRRNLSDFSRERNSPLCIVI